MLTTKKILKTINCPHLSLHQGVDYLYFMYDDKKDLFDTWAVMVMKINDLTLEQWIEEGKEFIKRMEA